MLTMLLIALLVIVCIAYYFLFWPILLMPAISGLGAPWDTLSKKAIFLAWCYVIFVTFTPIGIAIISLVFMI